MFLLIDVMHVMHERSMSGSSMNRVTYSACSSMSSIASSPRERSDKRMPSPLPMCVTVLIHSVRASGGSYERYENAKDVPHRRELVERCRDLE